MKTKKRSLQISRHSSSNSFCFPKKSILKLTQKVPLKLVVFTKPSEIRSEHARLARLYPIEPWDMYLSLPVW